MYRLSNRTTINYYYTSQNTIQNLSTYSSLLFSFFWQRKKRQRKQVDLENKKDKNWKAK